MERTCVWWRNTTRVFFLCTDGNEWQLEVEVEWTCAEDFHLVARMGETVVGCEKVRARWWWWCFLFFLLCSFGQVDVQMERQGSLLRAVSKAFCFR